MRRLMQIALALLIAWTISAQPSMANGRGRHNGSKRNRAQVFVRENSDNRVFFREPRGTYFYTRGSSRSRGWDRGRKVGWGDCDLPPGLAKKYGCNGYVYRNYDRSYYYPARSYYYPTRSYYYPARSRVVVVVPFR